jgi:hypothetical protein
MSIKTTLRVCLIAVRMDIIKKTKTTNIGEDGVEGILEHR